RTVGIVAADGSITLSAFSDVASTNNPRSAVVDGNNLWVGGGAGGIRTVGLSGNSATATTTTQVNTGTGGTLAAPPTNVRGIALSTGQLHHSTGSGASRFDSVGSGEPTAAGANTNVFPGLPTSGSTGNADPYEFLLLDLDAGVAGVDTLYYSSLT